MRFFSTLIGSFHSAALYRTVRTNASFYMGYTLLVVLLCTLVLTVYFTAVVHRGIFVAKEGQPIPFDSLVNQIAEQLPVMTLKDDTLMTMDPEPTVIRVSGELFGQAFTDVPLITIDTTGASTHSNMDTPILITSTEIMFEDSDEIKVKKLSEFTKDAPETLVINRALSQEMAAMLIAGVHKHIMTFYLIVGGICWFFFAIVYYIMRICMLLALGLAGYVLGSIIKQRVSYAAAVSLAAVSYTPIALLEAGLLGFLGYSPHMLTLFGAGVVALFFAMKCSDPARAPLTNITGA
jgi:hypothetical protein